MPTPFRGGGRQHSSHVNSRVGTLAAVSALAVGAIRAGRRALVRSTFDLGADFAQAEVTGARRDFVQQLTRVDP